MGFGLNEEFLLLFELPSQLETKFKSFKLEQNLMIKYFNQLVNVHLPLSLIQPFLIDAPLATETTTPDHVVKHLQDW